MSSDSNNQNGGETVKDAGEVKPDTSGETIALKKSEYEELVGLKATVGSMKRDLKDAQKALEEARNGSKDTPQKTNPTDTVLLKKVILRTSAITDSEEQELALSTADKWHDGDVEKLLADPDWSAKLEKHRIAKANAAATSHVEGGGGSSSNAKDTTDYWKAKGQPPTPQDVPDRKTRQKIIRELSKTANNKGIKFYNE